MARFEFESFDSHPDQQEGYWFYCPGCKCGHTIYTKGRVTWEVSGEGDNLTFAPSLRVSWADHVCHSFIRDGRIQFLNDCTHELAGQTVDIPDLESS